MRTIIFILAFIVTIPVVYGSILYKKLDKTMKWFLMFLSFSLFVSIIALTFSYLFRNNLIIYNTSQLIFVNLLVILYHSFKDFKLKKLNILYLIPFFIFIWTFFYSTGIDSIYTYSSVSSTISVLIILFFAFRYIIKLSSITKNIIYKSHIFWLLSGIICMHLIMTLSDLLFLFIPIYEIVNMQIIVIINNVISTICFTLAFYFYNKQYNENSQLQKSNS